MKFVCCPLTKLSCFHLSGVRATRVRMLRKEIALIRRKLNQEKRRLSECSGKKHCSVKAVLNCYAL